MDQENLKHYNNSLKEYKNHHKITCERHALCKIHRDIINLTKDDNEKEIVTRILHSSASTDRMVDELEEGTKKVLKILVNKLNELGEAYNAMKQREVALARQVETLMEIVKEKA